MKDNYTGIGNQFNSSIKFIYHATQNSIGVFIQNRENNGNECVIVMTNANRALFEFANREKMSSRHFFFSHSIHFSWTNPIHFIFPQFIIVSTYVLF